MKKLLLALALVLSPLPVAAQYLGAGYGGLDYFLADVFTNGLTSSYRTGTPTATVPVVVLQNTPNITTPNITGGGWTLDGVSWGGLSGGFNFIRKPDATFGLQISNSGAFLDADTITFRASNSSSILATLSSVGFALPGSSSGTVTLATQATAGTPTVTFGTSSGTPAVTASAPLAITAATGNITCATCLTSASTIPLTVGSTTIASGTNTRILYNNSGVLGEYTLTGTGTVVAMQTAPTFVTSITAPLVIGGSGTTGTQLTFQTTTGSGTTDQFAFAGGNNGATSFGTWAAAGLSIAIGNLTIATNTTPTLTFGTSGNVTGNLTSFGSGGFIFRSAGGSTLLTLDSAGQTSGVVNSVLIRGSVTGGGPSFIAQGSDTNVSFNFASQAAGSIDFYTNSLSSLQVRFAHTASANRYLQLTGSNGGDPTISTPGGGNLAITPSLVGASWIKTGVTTVGSLGTCDGTTQGARWFVTDSNAVSFTAGIGAVVAGGGATAVPVTCDGTNWRIG